MADSYLIDYVTLPGYDVTYNNQDQINGGGIGSYINTQLKYKLRNDIESKDKDLEHLWVQIPGKTINIIDFL